MSGVVVWLTGLPSSGKTTLARAVAGRLADAGRPAVLLDGDEVRAALVPPHGYDEAGRAAFYESLARLAALLAAQGHVVLVPATAPRRAFRARARALAPQFVEVHVATPLAVCEARDDKGHYGRALAGASSHATLPGPGVAFEPPVAPELTVQGEATAVDRLLALLDPAVRS